MAADYSAIITKLETARSVILDAMASGASATKEFLIRGRMVKFKDLTDELMKTEKMIRYYTDLGRGSAGSTRRTRARITRN